MGRPTCIALGGDGGAAPSLQGRAVVGLAAHLESRRVRACGAGIPRPHGAAQPLSNVRPRDRLYRAAHRPAHGDHRAARIRAPAVTSPNVVVEEMESFPRRAAQWLGETVARGLATRGHFAIALFRGTTARPGCAARAAPEP